MIDHVWTVLCTRSIIDKNTNNISLLEVLEEVVAAGEAPTEDRVPELPINAQLVTLWARRESSQPTRGRARVTFESPSHKLLFQREYAIDLTTHSRTRKRALINGLPVPGSGWYHFKVEVRDEGDTWREVARVPLEVEIRFTHTPA